MWGQTEPPTASQQQSPHCFPDWLAMEQLLLTKRLFLLPLKQGQRLTGLPTFQSAFVAVLLAATQSAGKSR